MIQLAQRKQRRTTLNIEYIDLPGEHIPLKDETIDTVVSTFTLGTIADIAEAMKGIARVLKPEGKLIFFELGLAPDLGVQRWQERLEPICRWLFQGLSVTRDIPTLLMQVFQIHQIETGYLAQFPKSLSYCCWGTASKHTKE
jgi:ubiquinone/menaquinone biosynthesis C-methylase UbiE